MSPRIERVGATKDRLGEGPLWDVAEQRLYWLDSAGCVIHRLDPKSGERRDWTVPDMIGCMALREGGGAVIGLRTGVHFFDFDSGEATPIVDPEADDERTRLNDGKVDRRGRFLVGSMGITQREPPLGSARLCLEGAAPPHRAPTLRELFALPPLGSTNLLGPRCSAAEAQGDDAGGDAGGVEERPPG